MNAHPCISVECPLVRLRVDLKFNVCNSSDGLFIRCVRFSRFNVISFDNIGRRFARNPPLTSHRPAMFPPNEISYRAIRSSRSLVRDAGLSVTANPRFIEFVEQLLSNGRSPARDGGCGGGGVKRSAGYCGD